MTTNVLNTHQLQDVESALTGSEGPALMEALRALSLGQGVNGTPERVLRLAGDLGWVTRTGRAETRLTALGRQAADPLREYLFWLERDRRHHEAETVPALHPDRFTGKRILEIGSGFGSNLFSLQERAQSVLGIEIEPFHCQLTAVLARLAGVPTPPVICGSAENLPIADASVDIVLGFGAVQYMRIERVLAECRRVLRDGGRFINIMSHFQGYLAYTLGKGTRLLRPRTLGRQAILILAMRTYPWLGRFLCRPHDPVYPTHARMRRWLTQAGLEPLEAETRIIGHETCWVAGKRACERRGQGRAKLRPRLLHVAERGE